MIVIDGAAGEGGGQVLRTSLALSAITGKPFRIDNIRAKRSKPGLLRQHLTAVKAATQIASARVSGDELGSRVLEFHPATVKHGEYRFVVGTAGSATLVFQTVLFPLLMAEGQSRLVFEGGTHNPMAPPFDFIAQTFLPLLHRMGARVTADLKAPGFYPAGGGRFEVEVVGGAKLSSLSLTDRGGIESVSIRAVVSQLPERIAVREMKELAGALADLPISADTAQVESAGPGNVVTVTVRTSSLTETFTAFGEIGVRAEKLSHRLAQSVRSYIDRNVPVGEHLADQLLIPLALAGGGTFRSGPPSDHTRTNADVIAKFLPAKVGFDELAGGCWSVSVGDGLR